MCQLTAVTTTSTELGQEGTPGTWLTSSQTRVTLIPACCPAHGSGRPHRAFRVSRVANLCCAACLHPSLSGSSPQLPPMEQACWISRTISRSGVSHCPGALSQRPSSLLHKFSVISLSPLVSTLLCDYRCTPLCLAFYMGPGDPNSGPCACEASTLVTGLPP